MVGILEHVWLLYVAAFLCDAVDSRSAESRILVSERRGYLGPQTKKPKDWKR